MIRDELTRIDLDTPVIRNTYRVGFQRFVGGGRLRGAGPDVELRAMQGALDTVAEYHAVAQFGVGMSADVVDGVKRPVQIDHRDHAIVNDRCLALARRDLIRPRDRAPPIRCPLRHTHTSPSCRRAASVMRSWVQVGSHTSLTVTSSTPSTSRRRASTMPGKVCATGQPGAVNVIST